MLLPDTRHVQFRSQIVRSGVVKVAFGVREFCMLLRRGAFSMTGSYHSVLKLLSEIVVFREAVVATTTWQPKGGAW